MVAISLKSLILSASVASLAAVATTAQIIPASPVPTPPSSPSPPPTHTPPPQPLDACGILGASKGSGITYEKVAACYKSVPFNGAVAASTLESILTIFNEFYTFRDSALAPTLAKPFAAAPVDILKVLETIGRTRYTSDHQYHTDLEMALVSLKDAHASYSAKCYGNYYFAQPLSLYAPVVNGKQTIQVFSDYRNRGYEGCTVQAIDSQDALTHINSWTDHYMDFAKDAGVRLNQALASLKYDAASGGFEPLNGDFSLRSMLPDKAHIDYELLCPNSTASIPIRDTWLVFPSSQIEFNSVQTFVKNVCEVPSAPPSPTSPQKRQLFQPEHHHLIPKVKKNPFRQASDAVVEDAKPLPADPVKSAVRVGVIGQATTFYQIQARPDVGVIHVHTHNMDDDGSELNLILQNLLTFHQNGVTRVILDFQGNFGGLVTFASTLVQMFFPNTGATDKTLPSNLRVTESIQKLTTALFEQGGGLYDATSFYDFVDKHLYTNNDLFMNPTAATRYGRAANYTEMTSLGPLVLDTHTFAGLNTLPWTNKAANIRLLTDGRCGSSCAMSSFFLTQYNKVISYVVGGITGEPMSVASFPGGAVSSLSNVHALYIENQLPSPFKPLPYNGVVRFTALEVFAPGGSVPLDYDPAYFVANHRLDYTPQNAKSREIMWDQVAASAWPV
ncbi:hypothetical protein BGX23_008167 [Mortierella sp. AD031]|nr:hypothetical protein BGX23_008167 [Mortierella sp. AD031]